MNHPPGKPSKGTPSELSYYDSIGMMLWLMSNADYHSQWPLYSLHRDIIPPSLLGQYKIYLDTSGNPVGLVTWAWLDFVGKEKVLKQCGSLPKEAWNSGDHLMVNDFVSPWGHARQIARDLRGGLFNSNSGFAIRRYPDGSIRKLMKGHGHQAN